MNELNAGKAQTAHLSECLAIDFVVLMNHVAPAHSLRFQQLSEVNGNCGITKRMVLAAQCLTEDQGSNSWQDYSSHNSDTVRGWACFMVGLKENCSLQTRFEKISLLAEDHHFGVREWAWLALRANIIA